MVVFCYINTIPVKEDREGVGVGSFFGGCY